MASMTVVREHNRMCLQGLWQLCAAGVAGIQGDEGHDGALERYLSALK